jgi:hypothetical protein
LPEQAPSNQTVAFNAPSEGDVLLGFEGGEKIPGADSGYGDTSDVDAPSHV